MPLLQHTSGDGPGGWRIMTIAGIPVNVRPNFLLLLVFYFFANASPEGEIDIPQVGIWCLAVFVSLIVHEFGHTQGLWDEYDDDIPGSPHIRDEHSIMNIGEAVRPRHYAPLAAWLTLVTGLISAKNLIARKSPLRYKVVENAKLVDMFNAHLQ